MSQTEERGLQPILLSSRDIDDVFRLYQVTLSTTAHGFLAIRNKDHYCSIFQKPEDMFAIGIRDGDCLVACSVCRRVVTLYPSAPVLSFIEREKDAVYHSEGWMVHPNYQGRGLGRLLLQTRLRYLAERRIYHVLGLAAIDNLASIHGGLAGGFLFIGFERDETALNYITYSGRLRDRLITDAPPIVVDYQDHDQQKLLFARRYVIRSLARQRVSEQKVRRDKEDYAFHFVPLGQPIEG
jgi:GNAT superfamily N-acetyltransferase